MAVITDTTGAYKLSIDSAGNALVKLAQMTAAAALADGVANPTVGILANTQLLFNGSTWDRNRNNFNQVIDASAARTASVAGTTCTNYNAKALLIHFKVSAITGTTPTITPKLQWSPDNGTTWIDVPGAAFASLNAVGDYVMQVGPEVIPAANAAVNFPLPRTLRMYYTIGGTSPSITCLCNFCFTV